MTRAGLRALVLDSLALWRIAGAAAWDGDALVVSGADGRDIHIRAAEPAAHPARWLLRAGGAGGRTRPAASITGLLSALRAALGPAPAGALRIAAAPLGQPLPRQEVADTGRTPVLIVTGALGSGKTTLIRRVLEQPGCGRIAVIVNEFGAVGLDHALIASSRDGVVQLTTGCLCCAARADVAETLLDLERRRAAGEIAFDRVLIETSGLADPSPALHALITDPAVASVFSPTGVLTLVDAVHGTETLGTLVEAQRQLALADRILITKTDAAPASPALHEAISALNPGAAVRAAAFGKVEPDWLFAPGSLPCLPPVGRFAGPMHSDGIGSVVIRPAAPVPAAALALFLQALAEHAGPDLLRTKGLLAIAEQPDRPALIHGVRHVFAAPEWLSAWPEGAPHNALVVIARDLPARWPARLLAAITDEVVDETARQIATHRPHAAPHPQQEAHMQTDSARSDIVIGRRMLGRFAAGASLALAAPAVIARAQPAALRIANIQPITGASAAYGWRARDGAQLTADTINQAGLEIGGATYRIELTVQDMANDPQQAVTLLRQAASNQDFAAVLGPSNSVGFVPSVPAAGQLQVPMVGAGSGAPIKQWNIWSYRVNPVSGTAIPALLRKVHDKVGFKKLAVIYDQTQDGQAGDAQVCKAQAKALGYEVVAFEAFRAGDQDFSAQLATIRVARPDAMFVAAATGDGVKVATQVRELGITVPMMTGFGSFQDPVYWDGTHGVIKDNYTWLAQDLASPTPAVKQFMDAYKQQFQQEATSFATYGADAVSAFAAAARKAGGVSRAKLQEALAELDTTTPIGTHLTFKNPPDGENNTPTVVVIQITGRGTYTTV